MENHDTSSAPGAFRLRWDVFLSFIGEDIHHHRFICSLYDSLEKHGIRAFRDDDGLRRGDEIHSSILKAIEDSAASIVIISPNYASVGWCLGELAKICEYGRRILPLFYQVDPSHVRHQAGPFEENFRVHDGRFGEDKVAKWKRAMKKAGGIAGYVAHDSDEAQEKIQSLLKEVLTELGNNPVGMATYTVGLDSRIEELMSVLDVKSNGIRVLGLHGIGGVGKTTLAKALYNKLFGQFERRSFISNVCENLAKDYGLLSLQNKLINDLSTDKNKIPVDEVSAGVTAIKQIVRENRVLIVLDNIDDERQLEKLTGRREWFYEGSRIIITTRDREALPRHLVNEFYEVRELDSSGHYSEALQLFSYHALRREKPPDSLLNLSKQIVSLTGGLPLALEVFGSLLFDKRRIVEWEDALQKLKRIRPRHLQDVLKISFDGLDEQGKCIFLDIACLFIQMGMTREEANDVLKGCGFMAEIAIKVLTAKSLIKVTEDNTLWMHDQVRDMGRQIVLFENPVNPGMRSRLWDRNEIMSVLKGEKGTENVQGIVLDFKRRPLVKYVENKAERERKVTLCTQHFESLVNLRLLQINQLGLEGKYKYFPAGLKWLQWKECPLKALPSDFCPRELAVLDLSESEIEHVWGSNKVAENLMVLNLRGCYNLAAIPDLSGHRTLEKLVIEGCIRLTKIDESIGNVSTLLHLNLRRCSNLIEFSTDVSGLKHVENLILSGCSKLKELPKNIGSMKSLKELLVDNTAIAELPESISHLTKLEKLSLDRCKFFRRLPKCIGKLCSLKELSLYDSAIEEIPDSVGSLSNLEKLNLVWCESLTAIPDSVGDLISLKELLVNSTGIKELPASIGSLSYLKSLSVGDCKFLSKLPDSVEGLTSLVELQLDKTPIINLPDQVGTLKILEKLEMRSCSHLRSLPESIGSMLCLTTLNLVQSCITELPESIGMLENLILLRMNQCKQLCKLPASFGKLKSLHHLHMEETAVTELPESFGMLSNLMILKMNKKPPSTQAKSTSVVLPTSFSNLCSLKELGARAWKISGKIPDDFERLSSLEILNFSHNDFCSLPSSLRGLSILKELILHHCVELKSLPLLPSSLVEMNVANCTSLGNISDLSNLEHLRNLNLTNCEKVVDVPGLECLKSLRMLCMSGCKACSSVVKRRLSKVCLRNLFSLSMPGSKIPDWFSQDEVRFSIRKNYEIRGVIIGVVVSVNYQMRNELRDLPTITGIQATIVKENRPIFNTMLHLTGVPKTEDDHLYLCRYPVDQPLVSMLEDGCRIQVTKHDSPIFEGIELKNFGIHLIFEDDDDYDGDEESLDESQQSISEKLTKFFSSLEDEEDHISGSGCEVEIEVREIEEQEDRRSTWLGFLQLFRRCFCF